MKILAASVVVYVLTSISICWYFRTEIRNDKDKALLVKFLLVSPLVGLIASAHWVLCLVKERRA
jgi:hypothetical protein